MTATRTIAECEPGAPIEWSVDGGPLLIRQGAADWPLTRSCAAGAFAPAHGARRVTARRPGPEQSARPGTGPAWDTTVREFLEYCDAVAHGERPAEERWYVKDWTVTAPAEVEAFIPAELPDCVRSWFRRLPAEARPAWNWIYLGPGGSRSTLHVDVMMSGAWNALAAGTKRWSFHSPAASTRMGILPEGYLELVEDRTHATIECTQEAGDLLIVPSGWAHEVVNTDTTIAATGNFVNARNAAFARRFLQSTGRTSWLKVLDALEDDERKCRAR